MPMRTSGAAWTHTPSFTIHCTVLPYVEKGYSPCLCAGASAFQQMNLKAAVTGQAQALQEWQGGCRPTCTKAVISCKLHHDAQEVC